jgi:NADPH:quinone reductase-like Zn-dependent oxidoreductase
MSRAMRAAVLPAHGAVPEFGDFDDPTPVDGQELLTVLAGGLNPVDIRIAGGNFPSERREPPYVPGKEGIGRREDGTRVYFDSSVAPFGSFAERTLIEAGHGIPIPDGLDEGVAVSLGIAGLAAWLGLEWRGELQPGETVLVLGASGVVGQIAVQAARLLGAGRVVAAARSAGGLERATALGADATVRLGEDGDLTAAFTEAAGGGIDVVIDPLWGEPGVAALAALNRFGRHVQLGQSASAEATVSSPAIRGKPVSIVGHTNFSADPDRLADAYARMAEHAAAGKIAVEVERVPLDQVAEAWRRQGESPNRKLVIVP